MPEELKEKIKWTEKEYKEWIRSGWKTGKETKYGIDFIDFIQYLRNKYKNYKGKTKQEKRINKL